MNANHDLKFRFRRFPVYQDARKFVNDVRQIVGASFPTSERYVLTSQILRAVYSIVLNIAEGSDKSTDKEFAHFLNIAHGSLNEVIACIDIAHDMGYLSNEDCGVLIDAAAGLGNQLTAFRNKLLNFT
jgi:four helix bundle protein